MLTQSRCLRVIALTSLVSPNFHLLTPESDVAMTHQSFVHKQPTVDVLEYRC